MMPLIDLKTVLYDAYQHKYAVGAFNIINLEFAEAVIAAAEASNSPVIISIAAIHFQYLSLENICPVIRSMAERTRVPVVLNLDHGDSLATAIRAVQNGFTSVMFDGSKLEFAENIRQTAEIVKICHTVGVSVEAELGAVGGAEGGGLVGAVDPSLFTDPVQAVEFLQCTGVDALAVAIGNAHGKYRGKPQLDFQRLESLRDVIGIPLVLHGGSGISDADFRRAVSLGIAKINFYTGMSQAAIETTIQAVQSTGQLYNDYPELLKQVKASVQKVVEEQMSVFGSTSHAN
jgi:fructose-bisphosphate aldolase class II